MRKFHLITGVLVILSIVLVSCTEEEIVPSAELNLEKESLALQPSDKCDVTADGVNRVGSWSDNKFYVYWFEDCEGRRCGPAANFAESGHVDLYRYNVHYGRVKTIMSNYFCGLMEANVDLSETVRFSGNFRFEISGRDIDSQFANGDQWFANLANKTKLTDIADHTSPDGYWQLGETVELNTTPVLTSKGHSYNYKVRIKYTLWGQTQYQTVHTNAQGYRGATASSDITLFSNPALAYKTIYIQFLDMDGGLIEEESRTIFP